MEPGSVEVVIEDANGRFLATRAVRPDILPPFEGAEVEIDGEWYRVRKIDFPETQEGTVGGPDQTVLEPRYFVRSLPSRAQVDDDDATDGRATPAAPSVIPLRLPTGKGMLASYILPPSLVTVIVQLLYRAQATHFEQERARAAAVMGESARFIDPAKTPAAFHALSRECKRYVTALQVVAWRLAESGAGGAIVGLPEGPAPLPEPGPIRRVAPPKLRSV